MVSHKDYVIIIMYYNIITLSLHNLELNAENVLLMLMKHEFSPAMWEILAVGLKLSHSVSKINADQPSVYSKLIVLVNLWVASDPDKSWNKLVSAVEMSGQKFVADKLAREVGADSESQSATTPTATPSSTDATSQKPGE